MDENIVRLKEKQKRKHLETGKTTHSSFQSSRKLNPHMKSFLLGFLFRTFIVLALSFVVLILCRDPKMKSYIDTQVYHTNLPFAAVKVWLQNTFGGVLPFQEEEIDKPVFQENLVYESKNIYHDGVSLTVGENYLVPALESGVVVYMGEKENYGYTVIVQQTNGIDTWYGNIEPSDLKLYDYIEKGSFIGSSLTQEIYLVFEREGKALDYQDYLQ